MHLRGAWGQASDEVGHRFPGDGIGFGRDRGEGEIGEGEADCPVHRFFGHSRPNSIESFSLVARFAH